MKSLNIIRSERRIASRASLLAALVTAALCPSCAEDSADLGSSTGDSVVYAKDAPPKRLDEGTLPLKSLWKLVDHAAWIHAFSAVKGGAYWIDGNMELDQVALRQCDLSGCRDSLATIDTWKELDSPTGYYDVIVNGQVFRLFWHAPVAQVEFCPAADCSKPTLLWKDPSASQNYSLKVIGATDEAVLFEASTQLASGSAGLKFCKLADCLGTLVELPDVPALTPDGLVDVQAQAFDDDYVYFGGSGGVRRLKLDGSGAIETIAPPDPLFGQMVLHGDSVYWTEPVALGTVKSCAKSGCVGAPTVLMSGLNHPAELVVDDTYLYVMEPCSFGRLRKSDRLLRCPLEGCDKPTVLSEDVGAGGLLTQDGDHLYFVGSPTCNCVSSSCSSRPADSYIAVIPK